MKAKASATPNPLFLEKAVGRLMRDHDLGAVEFRVVQNGRIFAQAMVRHGSPRAVKLIREAVEVKGRSVTLNEVSLITEQVAAKAIARGIGASFDGALAELRVILAKQKESAA